GFSAMVERTDEVVVSGIDRDGNSQTIEGKGLLARAFQHEMDHLNGTLFVDRLRGIKRELIVRRIAKLRRNGKW
nr:peptide deformylase [Pseudomonadales bacterium]